MVVHGLALRAGDDGCRGVSFDLKHPFAHYTPIFARFLAPRRDVDPDVLEDVFLAILKNAPHMVSRSPAFHAPALVEPDDILRHQIISAAGAGQPTGPSWRTLRLK